MKTLAMVLLLTLAGTNVDLSGKWSGSFKVEGGDHEVSQLFILKQQGKSLTGSGGPNAAEQYPIENGKIDGDSVRFQLTTGEWKFAYDFKIAGPDTLKGTLKLESLDESRTANVSLVRVK